MTVREREGLDASDTVSNTQRGVIWTAFQKKIIVSQSSM